MREHPPEGVGEMALRVRFDEPLRLLEVAGREGLGELG